MFKRLLGKEKRTTFIATCDQGVVSLGSFLANLMLARHLPTEFYGTYAVFYGVMLVAGSIVFRQPPGRVPMHSHYNWWDWMPGADWRRLYSARSTSVITFSTVSAG